MGCINYQNNELNPFRSVGVLRWGVLFKGLHKNKF